MGWEFHFGDYCSRRREDHFLRRVLSPVKFEFFGDFPASFPARSPASVFFYFAGLPGLRAEVRAFLFNYVRFKFHSRVFMKFTYCIYMSIDSISGLSLVLSL